MNAHTESPTARGRTTTSLLVLLALFAALGMSALRPDGTEPRTVVRAQSATPTPLAASSASSLDIAPGVPRPEPMGGVHLESSLANCVRNASGEMNEPAVAGVMIRLKNSAGTILRQQPTNSYGIFDLYDANVALDEGSYELDVVLDGTGWGFRCAQPGTEQSTVYSSPVGIESPGDYPEEMRITIGVN